MPGGEPWASTSGLDLAGALGCFSGFTLFVLNLPGVNDQRIRKKKRDVVWASLHLYRNSENFTENEAF